MTKTLQRPVTMLIVVLVASLAIQLFQISLHYVIEFHREHPMLVWLLPVAWIFFWLTTRPRAWRDFETTDQILRELQTPHRPVGSWLMPLIWVQTLWSHLFGASVGREGTALQMAASLADLGARLRGLTGTDRQALLRVGLAAGLAAAYQTPWAGFVFALELGGEIDHRTRLESLIGSWLSFAVAALLFQHRALELPQIDFDWELVLNPTWIWLTLGLVLFAPLYRICFLLFNRPVRHLRYEWRWLAGGVLGLALILFWSQDELRNLGTDLIDNSFMDHLAGWIFVKKTVLTALFCGMGWFGGDFTPNMAAGASAGNIIAGFAGFPLPALGAAMGLFLPVAFTHRIVATGWVMTLEYFGWRIALMALPVFILAWVLEKALERWVYPRLRSGAGH